MFNDLIKFKKIGWDFDKTLVDNPRARDFYDFIMENPYDQHHYIVTMRTHGLEENIFPDLDDCSSGLCADHFIKIFNPPNTLYENKPKAIILPGSPYFRWKGETCAQYGIEVLIDDEPHTSKEGCDYHGVIFIHPEDLK